MICARVQLGIYSICYIRTYNTEKNYICIETISIQVIEETDAMMYIGMCSHIHRAESSILLAQTVKKLI